LTQPSHYLGHTFWRGNNGYIHMYNFSIFAIDSSPHPILDIKKISFVFVQEIGCPRYQFKFQVEMRKHFQLTSKF
jgi:hypothetical protein